MHNLKCYIIVGMSCIELLEWLRSLSLLNAQQQSMLSYVFDSVLKIVNILHVIKHNFCASINKLNLV